jgi:hypothetical protein
MPWFVRHKFIVSEEQKYGDYYVLEDGREKLKYMMSSNEPVSDLKRQRVNYFHTEERLNKHPF